MLNFLGFFKEFGGLFLFGFCMVLIVFPDGSTHEFKKGVTGREIAQKIGPRLAREALAIELDGLVIELNRPLQLGGKLKVLTWNDSEGKKALWHTGSHVLAEAVHELFPSAKATIGPPIEEGFYYDFDADKPFSEADLQKIEQRMKKIIAGSQKIVRHEVTKEEALKKFVGNPYKQELINEFVGAGKKLSIYSQGTFFDLCKGGHVEETGKLKAVKLLKTAGAYWRGSEKNKMLQRIYGIAFPEQKMLDEFLKLKEEAAKRDHRKIGQELDLFWMHEYSPGSVFFLPKGAVIYNELIQFMRSEYQKRGFLEIISPQIFNKKLWETSGHWEHYRDNMFVMKIDEEEFSLKAMNCPSHVLVFKRSRHSYRDLPLRLADFGVLHRNELKGVLSGLVRVRKFSQDDSHTFCTEEQIQQEIMDLLDFTRFVYVDTFGMEFKANLSTRPEHFLGDAKLWDKAEKALAAALKAKAMDFEVKEGEGAFYGPKIDFEIKDALGRLWQLATIQLDFQMPRRFEAEYVDKDDKPKTPVMIHKAILGSLERFMAILVEQYAGLFPLWLSPVHAVVLTIADRHEPFAKKVLQRLLESGIRAELNAGNETLNYKVREAQLQKIPFILVVGDKEEQSDSVNVRTREEKVLGAKKIDVFITETLQQIKARK